MSQTHNLDVQDAKYIIIDLFPAEIEINGVPQGDQLKITVTDNRVYIFEGGPAIKYQDSTSYTQFDRLSNKEYTLTTGSGDTITFRRARNCGCGSQLRGVNPFIGTPFAKQKPIKKD